MDVIFIMWLRQLKRHFRSKARILGSIGQPILFLVALGFGFGPIFEKAGGGNYLQFLAPGVISMGILFTAVFAGMEVIWDKQFGFLKETLVAPISRLEIMVGRTLGGATISLFQGFVVFVISFLLGFRPEISGLPAAFLFASLVSLFFTALGTSIASLLEDMQGFHLIMNFLVMPTFFLSGALFPLDGLPFGISAATRLNPLSYGVDGLRGALIGGYHFGLFNDVAILSLLTLIMMGIGSHFFSKIQI